MTEDGLQHSYLQVFLCELEFIAGDSTCSSYVQSLRRDTSFDHQQNIIFIQASIFTFLVLLNLFTKITNPHFVFFQSAEQRAVHTNSAGSNLQSAKEHHTHHTQQLLPVNAFQSFNSMVIPPTNPMNPMGTPTALRNMLSTSFASFNALAVVAVFLMWNTDVKEQESALLCRTAFTGIAMFFKELVGNEALAMN